MKTLVAFICLVSVSILAAEPVAPKKNESKNYLDSISVSAGPVLRSVDFTDGHGDFGVAVDLGVGINKSVSLHVENVAYENQGWGGSTIDSTSFLVKASLARYQRETLSLYALASADRDWNEDDWGFGGGLGVELKFNRNISIGADSRIRAWFDQEKDLLSRAFLTYKF